MVGGRDTMQKKNNPNQLTQVTVVTHQLLEVNDMIGMNELMSKSRRVDTLHRCPKSKNGIPSPVPPR